MEDLFYDFRLVYLLYIALIVVFFVILFQIAERLRIIKKDLINILKIQKLQGIANGTLLTKKCNKCERSYPIDLLDDDIKHICPYCNFDNREGNYILKSKSDNNIISISKSEYERLKYKLDNTFDFIKEI